MRISTILAVALCLAFGLGRAAVAAPMGTVFTYQGRLIDANSVADGLYDLRFRLYDASVAGTQKGSTIVVSEVNIIDGSFTLGLDFGGAVFDGNNRWLEIGIRAGELNDPNGYTALSPRQEVTPTPYALYAASGPGLPVPLHLSGSSADPIIKGSNTGSGDGISGQSSGSSGHGVFGWASNTGNFTNYGGFFSAAGSNGSGVYGKATGSKGRGVEGWASHSGDYINYGGWFQAAGTYGQGVYGEATGGSGFGVIGYASNSGAYTNYGGRFQAAGGSGIGVYGDASNSGDYTNYGGYFEAAGTLGRGVYGCASNGLGSTNYGGYFQATGSTGRGVYGEASNSGGAFHNYGGYFRAAGGYGQGVYGGATGSNGTGVVGYATDSSGTGVKGYGGEYDFYAAGKGEDYGSASSIRWKRDIQPINEPLDKIMMLRAVYFNWDDEHGGQHDVGMIAEEVGEVLPEIVSYEENGVDATGMDYSKLTPLLVEAVKALKQDVDEQREQRARKDAEIAAQQTQIQKLQEEVAELRDLVAKMVELK